MSTDTAPPTPPARRRKRTEKRSLWQTDLSSLGKKTPEELNEALERPPFEPTLPQVNLLPSSVLDSMAVARIRNWAILAIVLLAGAVAAVWWLQTAPIDKARADLAAAQAENAQLQDDIATYGPIKKMYDQITKLKGVVTTTMASQPQAAAVLERFDTAAETVGGISVYSNGIAYTGIPAAGTALNMCPKPDPFDESITIGCMTFQGNASSRQEVSDFLRTLEADPMFVGPYVTNLTVSAVSGAAETVSFSGTVGVSLDALDVPLTEEQLAALSKPAPSPTDAGTTSEGATQ